ncbi:hypothetical protein [Nocardia transvalensis]|nr:hypothetical protein [Nocardia transvalensis]
MDALILGSLAAIYIPLAIVASMVGFPLGSIAAVLALGSALIGSA